MKETSRLLQAYANEGSEESLLALPTCCPYRNAHGPHRKRRRIREMRSATEGVPRSSSPTPGDDIEQADADRVVSELLAGLGTKDRAALLMRFYEGQPFRAIGEALGLSEDSAQKRVSRALEKMRRKSKTFAAGTTGSAIASYLARVGAARFSATLPARILQQMPGGNTVWISPSRPARA